MEFEECWATANQLRNWRRLKKTLAQIWRFRETNRFSTMVRRKLRKINDTPLKSRVETGDIYVSPLYRSEDINYTFFPLPGHFSSIHHQDSENSFLGYYRNCIKKFFYCVKIKVRWWRKNSSRLFSINYSPRSPRFARLLATLRKRVNSSKGEGI